MSVEVIERTPLPNDVVVVTAKRMNPTTLIRPFCTFAVAPTSRYAQRLADFATEAAALHQHAALARDPMRRKA